MRLLKLDAEILLEYYFKEIRSILEFGVACWNSGLTLKMISQIERVQKICINIILYDNNWDIDYNTRCTLLGIEPLHYRRTDLCIRFITKASLDPCHSDLFMRNSNTIDIENSMPGARKKGDFTTVHFATLPGFSTKP